MKWILLALLTAGFCSCKDDDTVEAIQPEGNVTVMLNGEDFLAQYTNSVSALLDEACYADRFVLSSSYAGEDGTRKMVFGFIGLPISTGTYYIERNEFSADRCAEDITNASFTTWLSDGDVKGDTYLLVDGADNFITIETYNSETHEISGIFQMTLAVDLPEHRPVKYIADAPDTIRLTEGQFKVTLVGR